ncbi:uncharacterized protein N7483_011445 [Penicillium malachiteum]|uniref:uncharacterized protein n=1 Tax=Penicillium malachiteum TaxID=1324776 RepID=UPI002548D7E1|nr:uncharacterized protein N7483_011445 [Penicillium malachiteum]KAJ5714264.1 hypothetical protein N7483_011445 [Penicillium malachiteum]
MANINTNPSRSRAELTPSLQELLNITARYEAERKKRLRKDGNAQYIEPSNLSSTPSPISSNPYSQFSKDPWVDLGNTGSLETKFPSKRTSVLIIGAGWGGLQNAIRIITISKIPAAKIRIIDAAGSFGGTWYWNRYPGLMCDIESHMYLPYLEETGYIPRHKYAYGSEIRSYAETVAQKWGLTSSAVFQTTATKIVWDEDEKEWAVDLVQRGTEMQIRASFVVLASGVLHSPKLPLIPGLLEFKGKMFHSSRWDYEITGGSEKDLSLHKLKGKRVAIIGTGATAVQIVPILAKWCKHLYVVQRTPSAVDTRDQRKTDIEWFHQHVASGPGWQRARIKNFHRHLVLDETEKPAINLVNDGWTRAPGLLGLTGHPNGPMTPDEIPAYRARLIELDTPRQNRIRARVDQQVHDPIIAEKLKPWYPTWCKRPAFHDDYLQAFNRTNVTLIDTDGKGVDEIKPEGLIIGDRKYNVDVIIFATGYQAPPSGSPAEKANMTMIGVNGVSLSEEWAVKGPATLHGVLDAKFPNLFLSGPQQASTSGNYRFNLDELAKHTAYILAECNRRAKGAKFAVAPSVEATEEWAMQVIMRSAPFGVMAGCTPGYLNLEGDIEKVPPEKRMILARSSVWGWGIENWIDVIEKWRDEGSMKGIVVR